MSTSTTNYSLVKPDGTEDADVDVLNDNMDLIDAALNRLPTGVIGKTLTTADGPSITSASGLTEWTALNTAVTVKAGRRYKICIDINFALSTTKAPFVIVVIKDTATEIARHQLDIEAESGAHIYAVAFVENPTAGAKSYRVFYQTSAGTLRGNGAGSISNTFWVEDMGAI